MLKPICTYDTIIEEVNMEMLRQEIQESFIIPETVLSDEEEEVLFDMLNLQINLKLNPPMTGEQIEILKHDIRIKLKGLADIEGA